VETEKLLGSVELFKHLDRAALAHLAAKLKLVSLPEGLLVKEGDPGDALYIIKSGVASVTKTSRLRGMEAVLAILKRGGSFGELALIDGLPRSADVAAVQPVECYILRRDDFLAALDEHPEIARGMLPYLAAMVRNADSWIGSLIESWAARQI